jgi:general secretion pathway protein A
MYESYFNLRESPFNLTPDPRFFFSNASVREAFATLCYGVEQRKGIIVITGEAGTGKTMLLKRFMQSAAARVHTSCILDPHLTLGELLLCAFGALGLPPCGADRLTTVQQLNRYLIEQLERDHVVTLLLDEAQDLDDSMLEELRLLADLEEGGERLLQVVLVGQPPLDARLETPSFDRLKQRVTLRSKLRPLEREEIRSYIDYRLLAAGYGGEAIFSAPAIERIAAFSWGIPRLINVICDNALLIACATSQRGVGAEIIDEVAEDLQLAAARAHVAPWALQAPPRSEAPIEVVPVDDRTPTVIDEVADDRDEDFMLAEIPSAAPIVPPARADESEPPEIKWAGLIIGFAMLTLVVAGVIAAHQTPGSLEPVSANITRIKQAIAPLPGRIYRVLMARGERADAEDVITYAEDKLPGIRSPRRQPRAPVQESLILAPMTLDGDSIRSRKASSRPRAAEPETRSRRVRHGAAERAPIDYVVVDDSFVRKQPTSEAKILMTLHPGTHIQLVNRRGDYLQVRSRERGLTQGYVHKEDAFFERLN